MLESLYPSPFTFSATTSMDAIDLYASTYHPPHPLQSLYPRATNLSPLNSMGDHTAFFYGTLMAPSVLHRVCHGTSEPSAFYKNLLRIRPAVLHRYRRHRVKAADYPALLPDGERDACVRGTLVEGLTDGDIWRLDIFEGDEYERRKVETRVLVEQEQGGQTTEGEKIVAETYVWISARERLEDEEWDFDQFVREKMRFWEGRRDSYDGRPTMPLQRPDH